LYDIAGDSWMYDLFDLYGPVPAITDPEKILNPTQDFTVTRPSREEYITFVETELKEVVLRTPNVFEFSLQFIIL